MNLGDWHSRILNRIQACWMELGLASHEHSDATWSGLVLEPLSRDRVAEMGYHSQLGQDVLLDRCVFSGLENGIFVDVGAHDGKSLSNSYFLETTRGWGGLALEPNPDVFELLRRNRRATALNVAASSQGGVLDFTVVSGYSQMLSGLTAHYPDQHKERIEREIKERGGSMRRIQVKAVPLAGLLHEHNVSHIDALMIDTEGSELATLQGIDFSRLTVGVVLLEENYKSDSVAEYLSMRGFQRRVRLGWDSLFFPTATSAQ